LLLAVEIGCSVLPGLFGWLSFLRYATLFLNIKSRLAREAKPCLCLCLWQGKERYATGVPQRLKVKS